MSIYSSLSIGKSGSAGLTLVSTRYCAHATLIPYRWLDSSEADHSFALGTYACANSADSVNFSYACMYTVEEVEQLGLELMVKVALCAVSTGANVLIGRVYGNIMINLTVANDKV